MKQILFLLINLLLSSSQQAQIVKLQTQAEVNNFTGDYAGTQLIIGPDTCCSDITDLSPLSTVWGIGHKLRIQNNPLLKSLHGLENLIYIQSYPLIEIINNDSLPDLTGLADSIGQYIGNDNGINYTITGNAQLINLAGIADCGKAHLILENNSALRDLEGCEVLDQLESLRIMHCENFQNFYGLENVDTILQSLLLQYCPRIKNLEGLNNCKAIKYLYWNRLDSLENTDGLGNLRFTRQIEIDSCARFRAMTDLEKLGIAVDGEWIDHLEITWCPWFGDFSGLSDTAYFVTTYLSHSDSIETVQDFQRLHGNAMGIFNAYNLKYLNNLPIGVTWFTRAPSGGANSCPNLEYIHDTISGRVDSMSIFGFYGCPKLTDISGYNYVKGVTDHMGFQSFAQGQLMGIENLKWSRWIYIQDCELDNLNFLSGLDSVGLSFTLSGNIKSLSGLENLRTTRYLEIGLNDVLKNLHPIDINTKVETSIILRYLTKIDSINGFNIPDLLGNNASDNVQIRVEGCTNLKSITGYNGVSTIPEAIIPEPYDNILIQNNDSLKSIHGFQNLVYLKKDLTIRNNPNLSDISGFCNLFQNGVIAGNKHIQDNAPGANSYVEALETCISSGTQTLDNEMTVSVYPNPATGSFTVSLAGERVSEPGKIRITDMAGSIISETPVQAEQTNVSCSGLPAGVYWVRIYEGCKMRAPVKLVVGGW